MLVNVMAMLAAKSSFPPKFCKGLNCPNFTVTDTCKEDKGSVFEIREYAAAEWVGSTVEGPTTDLWESTSTERFYNNFMYISGGNSEGKKIKMTAPVRSVIVPGQTAECNTTIRSSFFLPYQYQAQDGGVKPPTPTNKAVTLQKQPAYTLAVRSFGGYMKNYEKEVQPQLVALAEQLTRRGMEFNESRMVVQGYDSPFTVTGRHNEVAFFLSAGTKCSQ